MEVSVQFVGPVEGDLVHPNDWGHLWGSCNQGNTTASSLVADLGTALEDALVLLSTTAPSLEGLKVCHLQKEKECGDLIIEQDESLNGTCGKKSGEHGMPPCSENLSSCVSSTSEKDEISDMALDGLSLGSHSPTSTSMSLPISLKLVSAMKGSREKEGLHVGKLSGRWDPGVYDPPATSQSHTLKSHNQNCSMMSNKIYRHKHKGKSSRSSSTDKKKHRRSR